MKYIEYRGIEGLVAAKVTKDDSEGITYDEVRDIAGINELTKETASASATHYYDNVPAIVIDSVGADTIKMNTSAVDLATYAWLTGQTYDEETGVLIEGEREPGYFALGYRTQDTDGNDILVWRLKGTFGIPGSTHKSKDDGTDANGQEVTFTGINTTTKFKKTGKTAKAVTVETVKNLVDVTNFFATVQTPDTLKAKSNPSA